MKFEEAKRLRIYLTEGELYEKLPLHEWLFKKALDMRLAGATVLRCMEGFGHHHVPHASKILSLSQELPIVVEIVDSTDHVDSFLDAVERAVAERLLTIEDVRISRGATPVVL